MLGRFCEKAERGMTTAHPASWAFIFRSPGTCETKPTIEVDFLNLERSLGIRVRGLMLLLFRSTMISDGFSSPSSPTFSVISLSLLTNSTLTFSLRDTSWILARENRSSIKQKIRVGAPSRGGNGSGGAVPCTPVL